MNTSVSQSPLIKIHVGCGTNKLPGWVNIDSVEEFRPDIVHDITTPLPYTDLSVDELLAEDLLEHFDKYQRFLVFYEWARVLKVYGTITLQVPNFKKFMSRFFKFGWDNFIDCLFGENIWRSEFYIGHFGNHKWAYTEKSLKEFVSRFGISTVSLETKGLNLRLTGQKTRHVTQEELDKLQIYSHANATGMGQSYLPLGVVRERIKIFESNLKKNN